MSPLEAYIEVHEEQVFCSSCRLTGIRTVVSVDAPQGACTWYQYPDGWWVEWGGVGTERWLRCRKCLQIDGETVIEWQKRKKKRAVSAKEKPRANVTLRDGGSGATPPPPNAPASRRRRKPTNRPSDSGSSTKRSRPLRGGENEH